MRYLIAATILFIALGTASAQSAQISVEFPAWVELFVNGARIPPPPSVGIQMEATPAAAVQGEAVMLTLLLPAGKYPDIVMAGNLPPCVALLNTGGLVCTLMVRAFATTIYEATALNEAGSRDILASVLVTVRQ